MTKLFHWIYWRDGMTATFLERSEFLSVGLSGCASDGMSNYNFYLKILNKDFPHVRVCCQADSTIMDYLSRLPVTSNFHHWCLTMQNFTQ